jgi:hypothetical protein
MSARSASRPRGAQSTCKGRRPRRRSLFERRHRRGSGRRRSSTPRNRFATQRPPVEKTLPWTGHRLTNEEGELIRRLAHGDGTPLHEPPLSSAGTLAPQRSRARPACPAR